MQLLHYGTSPQKCVHLKETTHKRKRGRGVNGVQKRVHSSSNNRHSLLIIDSACVPFRELCCWIVVADSGTRRTAALGGPWRRDSFQLYRLSTTHGRDSFQLYRSSTTHTCGTAFSSTVHQRHTRATHTCGTAFSSTVHQRHTRAGQLSALPFINDTHGRDSFQLYRSSTTHTGGTALSSTVHQRHTQAGQLSALPFINDTHGRDSFQLYCPSTTHTIRGHSLTSFI